MKWNGEEELREMEEKEREIQHFMASSYIPYIIMSILISCHIWGGMLCLITFLS